MKTTEAKLYINGVLANTHPIYSDKIAITTTRQEGEMYRRTNLNSEFQFLNEDYDLIHNEILDSLFEIRLFDKGTNTLLARGMFTKMDCDFDTDNKICKVKTTSSDDYDKILSGMNNEYDLISLVPKRETIILNKRPILQIYVIHDNKVTNIIGNSSYEVDVASGIDVDRITRNELINDYNFDEISSPSITIDITSMPSGYTYLQGKYIGEFASNPTQSIFERNDGTYKIRCRVHFGLYYWRLEDASGNPVSYQGTYWIGTPPRLKVINPIEGIEFGRVQESSSAIFYNRVDTMVAEVLESGVFARILVAEEPSIPDKNMVYLDSDDFVLNNINYKLCIGGSSLISPQYIIYSDEVQSTPTKWGVNGEGQYFVKPSPLGEGDNVIPIGWSRWIPKSIWFNISPAQTLYLDQLYNIEWKLLDAIPIWDAIRLLLNKIDPTINFYNGAQYSQFLYGTIDNSVLPMWKSQWLYITPITNVKRTYYNQAARKGTITLGNILDMLRNTMQLYWFVEREETGGVITKRLRIEHITWFKNGGNYAQQSPLINLTQYISPMSRKDWSFGQNIFSYDKSILVKRYEFGWGNDCTEPFNGFPIDINNEFASSGKKLDSKVGNFIADIDMIISSPDMVSDDSFALIGVDRSTKKCPIHAVMLRSGAVNFEHPDFILQNPYLSFFFTEVAYWRYDLCGDDATTELYQKSNGGDGKINVEGKKRFMTSTLKFPLDVDKVGKEGLIASGVGVGEWVKSSYTGEDGMVEMDIVMDIEEDLVVVDNVVKKVDGSITIGISRGVSSMSIVFDGGKVSAIDYAYVHIIVNKDVRVTITPSSETNFDIGWADSSPIMDYVTAKEAEHHASGTTPTSFTLDKGDDIYIGYAKDGSGFANNDKITFNIVEN